MQGPVVELQASIAQQQASGTNNKGYIIYWIHGNKLCHHASITRFPPQKWAILKQVYFLSEMEDQSSY